MIAAIDKGGEAKAGVCDQKKCKLGADYFGKRMSDGSTTSCDDAKLDTEGKDWHIEWTLCEAEQGGYSKKGECYGVGGWKSTTYTKADCKTGAIPNIVSGPVKKGECIENDLGSAGKMYVKYETTCDGSYSSSGASSLKGMVIVGMMTAILTAVML